MNIKTKQPLLSFSLFLLIGFCLFWVFRYIDAVSSAVSSALSVCIGSIIPSIFPFLILSEFLTKTVEGKRFFSICARPFSFLFRVSERGACAYLGGLLLGFPIGAKQIAEAYEAKEIEKSEAEHLLLFSNNTGPAFVVGCLGGLFGSFQKGVLLYIGQCVISLLCGIFLSLKRKRPTFAKERKTVALSSSFSLAEAIPRAAIQMLSICGYVLFFSALSSLLFPLYFCPYGKAFILSLLEIGTASSFIARAPLSLFSLPFAAFAICFSGLSVYFQGKELWEKASLRCPYYLPCKLLQGIAAFLLFLIFSLC
ncbi:MAG: hypothetical protein J6K61_03325 [Clostridia bacterium]|nr:hypothetical protein [Clostridia bacterium]